MSRTTCFHILSSSARAIFALAVVALATNAANAALVHRYSFNNGGAGDSINNAHGLVYNGGTISGGQLNLAGSAQGNGQYMALPANGTPGQALNVNTYTNITVAAWYTGPAVDPGGFRSLFMFGGTVEQPGGELNNGTLVGFNNGVDYLMVQPWRGGGPANANRAAITNISGGAEAFSQGNEFLDGLEHCYAVTVSKTATGSELKYYLDGVQVGTTATPTFDLSALSSQYAYVGRGLYNDPTLPGSINEFRIYNHTLTAAQAMAACMAGPNQLIVPEPATAALGLMGLAGVFGLRRRS